MERRQIVATTASVLMAGALIVGALGPGSETSAHGAKHFNCTNATLEGRYAVIGGGFVPSGAPPAPLFPFARLSLMTLDGRGTLSDQITFSGNSQVFQGVQTGTYTVNADCRGR